jgi:hypothetical protein
MCHLDSIGHVVMTMVTGKSYDFYNVNSWIVTRDGEYHITFTDGCADIYPSNTINSMELV